jgi:outer membrane lipoprotein-sorting protein
VQKPFYLMRIIFYLFFIVLVPFNTFAGEGRVLLDRFLTETQTMSANFTQTLKSSDGKLLQESAGTFYLQRPGRFRR